MMSKRYILTILLAVFGMMNGISQEYLTGFNGVIPDGESQELRDEVVVTLPFFDDFTRRGTFPDATKWVPGNVIANSSFPYKPVNYRAATLDVIDRTGKVYSRGSSNPFIADSLLSVKIRLDSLDGEALKTTDSLYLSFYYQPGGFGDSPERDDSLVLMFGYDGQWRHMWSTAGEDFQAFVDSLNYPDTIKKCYFKKVMIPITESCFLVDDFQILFYNYGTLPTTMYPNDRSNMDQWNIDFVYLDKGRSINNDTYPLVSLTGTAQTFLSRYQSMPYKHFKDNPIDEIENVYDIMISDMDDEAHDVRYTCKVEDNNSNWSYEYNKNSLTINKYQDVGIVTNTINMDDFIYPYNLSVDTTSFRISQYVEVVDKRSGEVRGDSIISTQGFYNYFAYDDGTPEQGYGLVPGDTYMAAKFDITQLDTVSGVQLLFNRTLNDANFNFFDILVWRDNNGKPGEVIYTLANQRPIWDDELIYKFSYYTFKDVVKVNSTFYVGIRQQYSKSINIGFDSSKDNRQNCYYNAGDGWKNTSFPGSLMIRPIMGSKPYFVNVEENQEVSVRLYPNPACNVIHIDGIDNEDANCIVIVDLTGRVVKQYQFNNDIDVSDLQNGMYMLCVINKDGSSATTKLLISK